MPRNMWPSQSSATRRDEIGNAAELGAGEGGGNRIAAKGDGVILRHRLFVAARDSVTEKRDVDIGVADEERLQTRPRPFLKSDAGSPSPESASPVKQGKLMRCGAKGRAKRMQKGPDAGPAPLRNFGKRRKL